MMPQRIITGGQTGVDQAALLLARGLHFLTGGTAPKGWRTDDGPAPWLADYGLVESFSRQYAPRTIKNVRDAQAVVWFGVTDSPGAKLTIGTARRVGRPYIVNPSVPQLTAFLEDQPYNVVLCVAGNRLRTHPEAALEARRVLALVLPELVPF